MVSTTKLEFRKGLFKIIPVAIVLSVLSISCRVSWVAAYNASIAQQIEVVAKKTDKFYLTMQETTENENNQRNYSQFAEQYIDIEVELKNLLDKNERRSKNQESIKINKTVLDKWLEYKKIHKKKNEITNDDIELNLVNLRNLLNTFRVAEEAKGRIK